MHKEINFEKFVDTHFPAAERIRRTENGSIDYDHYLKADRTAPCGAFSKEPAFLIGLARRILRFAAGSPGRGLAAR